MTADSEKHRAELKRLAFGRTDSPADHIRANEALRQLLETDDSESLPDAGDTGATLAAVSAGDGQPDRRFIALPRWLIPVAAVGLIAIGAAGGVAIGAAGGVAATRTPTTKAAVIPSAFPMEHHTEIGAPLDVVAAELPPLDVVGDRRAGERWFADEQTAADAIPTLPGVFDPSSTRFVMHVPGKFAWNLWIARATNGSYCVHVTYAKLYVPKTQCMSAEGFSAVGLSLLTSTDAGVRWDSAELRVSMYN